MELAAPDCAMTRTKWPLNGLVGTIRIGRHELHRTLNPRVWFESLAAHPCLAGRISFELCGLDLCGACVGRAWAPLLGVLVHGGSAWVAWVVARSWVGVLRTSKREPGGGGVWRGCARRRPARGGRWPRRS